MPYPIGRNRTVTLLNGGAISCHYEDESSTSQVQWYDYIVNSRFCKLMLCRCTETSSY